MTIRAHFDVPPTFQWREDHEQVGRAIALGTHSHAVHGVSWLRRDRHARFGNELLHDVSSTHTTETAGWIERPMINLQHIFHAGYEGSVGVRRDDPLLF